AWVSCNQEYVAMSSALLASPTHNIACDRKIEVVVFPAMGTGFGGVPVGQGNRSQGWGSVFGRCDSGTGRSGYSKVAGRIGTIIAPGAPWQARGPILLKESSHAEHACRTGSPPRWAPRTRRAPGSRATVRRCADQGPSLRHLP